MVQFDKISKLIPSSKVIINDQKAAAEAVQHLIDKGCRPIAHIRGPENPQNAIDRFLGYKKTLEKNNIPFDPRLVYTCTNVSFEEGLAFGKQIIEDHSAIDGIFVITDLVAVGVLSYFNEHGINVPADIKIIGFSNWFMSKVITPKLSSVEQPSYEMGVVAFDLLLDEINCFKENIPFLPKTIELATRIVERESTQKKPLA